LIKKGGYFMRFKRSRNKMIAGVCGGIAEYFNWDPTLVRVGYVLLSVISAAFPGILVYIILWIVMPPPESDIERNP
jgi:phage shock protein C